MRTLDDIEQDITAACRVMREYRDLGDDRMAAHYERWMNVKLDELKLRLPLTVA